MDLTGENRGNGERGTCGTGENLVYCFGFNEHCTFDEKVKLQGLFMRESLVLDYHCFLINAVQICLLSVPLFLL